MKRLIAVAGCLTAAFLAGCATQSRVAQMEGRGESQVFAAPYEQVWRASIDAAQISNLEIQDVDVAGGYISTRRGIRPGTTGENVGIWVRRIGPGQTQVEVVSRWAGPPRPFTRNWERPILSAIEANVSREMAAPTFEEPAGAGVPDEADAPEPAPPPLGQPMQYRPDLL